ncbi:uncharacterized protein LOC122515176 [Polistes fuscatus]|uniref:uncharacterized protein LOC122515176 n=1 Tax=Polistes fuscatus TaxID=30207 RepID=UPI001CA8EE9A|nr:uncharacterized protein LOC122515176 [Polistes fuscatus]XP_043488359.1 uncharacterized protein LOC122515176 [Polistes fuscatus]XP_043488368.1 uncharacterized protein LOC122515176 [Polistes fuscatus]XP_043488374.1 uncharacterized protein LOC122515176 [Polistes fuscatus]XP_043488379.1 uncharacterized protein LOC122515176 [Polistes fuscatus]XP_043488389.1 uncharacterized protein LOC122515176 [Polistes fuscatus]
MGLDAELTVILYEIVQFLESLRDTNLSSTMETVRKNLLLRSKNALSVFTKIEGTTSSTSSSAEPYLRMNASSKGLLPLNIGEINEFDMPEYVGAEATTSQNEKCPNSEIHPDSYETFPSKIEDEKKKKLEESQENALVNIYSSLSASQAKSKALKCGILFRKEGKKLFVFEQYRINYVALVGSHLLIYGNERDNKPYTVTEVRGYSGRPAPNIVSRDQKRSEAAFEIFKPGNKTLQFIARTPKDMEQWVAKICQVGSCEINNFDLGINSERDLAFMSSSVMFEKTEEIITKDRPLDSTKLQTTFSNVNENKTVEPDNESKVQKISENTSLPPLPTRIPRSLPPLPSNDTISSYESMYNEEDDIYYRIEDLGDGKFYQNFMSKNQKEIITIEKSTKTAAVYDDVQAILQKERQTNMKSKSEDKDLSNTISNKITTFDKTYDDINTSSVIRDKNNCESLQKDVIDANESQSSTTPKTTDLISYDNVETLANAASDNKLKDNKNNEIQKKTPTKKFFLDRMRNKKESPQKREKIITAKRETLTPPPQIIQAEEVTTYDDVSDLIIKEMSEYICPPAPRPIYTKPPTVIKPVNEKFYDDVNGCHEKRNQQIQSNTQKLENRISDDCEHYKLPRSNTWQQISPSQMEEQIYDDVTILANFTARQKEISDENKDQDSSKACTSPDKRSWNRFSRKHRSSDSIGSGTNKRTSNEITDLDCFEDQQNLSKMNTFQKLINKMENSLGKVSPKAISTTSVNKSYGLNSSS